MNIFYYDKTFHGLLCAIFDAYKLKCFPDLLLTEGDIVPMFTEHEHLVETLNGKYDRVNAALQKKLSKLALNQLMCVWLSELPEREMMIFRYICKVLDNKQSIETNFADPDILAVRQLSKKVAHERHYIMMFVRFNKTSDDIYFSPVAPRYNILPLVTEHFKDRFANQKWAIYDEKRGYGYYYDLHSITEISLHDADDFLVNNKVNEKYMVEDEKQFTLMWQHYFKSLTIKERINPKLQKQHMPKRFWHYLPETWTEG